MQEQINILGDGAMGTLCAILLQRKGHRVRIWGAFPQDIARLASTRENPRLLPGLRLPDEIELTADDPLAFAGATLLISAVPTQFLRSVWNRLQCHYPPAMPIISITKGIEISTLQRPTQIIADVLGPSCGALAVLSGPNIASEIARQLPATSVIASVDSSLAVRAQTAFTQGTFRVYTNNDPLGVELAGALKNVIALAAGMVDGLGLGSNAKAALLARGLVEITRLGIAMGAQPATFSGLAGLGDLVTTCISPEGRNRRTGQLLGQGQTLKEILAQSPSVIEGVPTAQAVMQLARQFKIDMPITAAVHAILFAGVTPAEALQGLMSREMRPE